ncbi:MAG: leucine-rich repeat protein [Candidatus Bipolaricaulia bacterium]
MYSTQSVLAGNNGVTDPGYFEFNADAGAITGYETSGGLDVVIPSQIDEVDVKEIGLKSLTESDLTSVEIPDGVEVIKPWAFSVNKLTSVEIPESVKEIVRSAFQENFLFLGGLT